nr:cytochrome c biogenesis CcdA family protein [uncultured Roseateles sp.]
MLSLLLSLLAGALSTLSPCVLPLVPIIMSSALQAARFGPVALLAGLTLSYTLVGTGLALFGSQLGVESGQLRMVSAGLMLGFGVIFLSSRLQQAFVRLVAPLTDGANARLSGFKADSSWGQGLLGAMLGLVWSPCVGPTLGAAVTLAAQGHSATAALSTMFVFGLGAALPMVLLVYGSRAATASRRRAMGEAGRWGKRVMGLGLMLVGALVLSGADHGLEALLTRHMPPWLLDLTTRF